MVATVRRVVATVRRVVATVRRVVATVRRVAATVRRVAAARRGTMVIPTTTRHGATRAVLVRVASSNSAIVGRKAAPVRGKGSRSKSATAGRTSFFARTTSASSARDYRKRLAGQSGCTVCMLLLPRWPIPPAGFAT